MIESGQLQTMVAVAKYCSFSRAAEELGVTQSAISQSIKNLEKKVKATLFKRSGKQVVLTQEGQKLCKLAREYLVKFNDCLEDIAENKNQMRGKVRIGTLFGLGKSWLGPEVIEFTKENEDISVEIILGFPGELQGQFENFSLDALVVPDFAVPQNGEKTLIGDEKSVLVMPPEFEVEFPLTIDHMASFPTVTYERDDSLYSKWCRSKFGAAPKHVRRRLIVNSHGNILKAVMMGLGVAVVPTHVLARSSYKSKVRTLGEDYVVHNSKVYFVTHKESLDLMRINALKERLTHGPHPLSESL